MTDTVTNPSVSPTTFPRPAQAADALGLTPAGIESEAVLRRRRLLVLVLNAVTLAALLLALAHVLGAGGWSAGPAPTVATGRSGKASGRVTGKE